MMAAVRNITGRSSVDSNGAHVAQLLNCSSFRSVLTSSPLLVPVFLSGCRVDCLQTMAGPSAGAGWAAPAAFVNMAVARTGEAPGFTHGLVFSVNTPVDEEVRAASAYI